MKNSEVLLNFWGEMDINVERTPLDFHIEIYRDELLAQTVLTGGYHIGWRSSIPDNDIYIRGTTPEESIEWLRRRAQRTLRDHLARDGVKALLESDASRQHDMENTLTGDVNVVVSTLVPENMILLHPKNFGQFMVIPQWFQFKDD